MFKGLGGPGAGHINGLTVHPGLRDMLEMNRAMGYGFGAYGYPLAYGITPWGQQAQMLSNQWPSFLTGEMGDGGPGRTLPSWFTFGRGGP